MKPQPNRFLHSDPAAAPLTCRKMLPIRQTLNPLKIRAGHKSVLIEVCELFENGGRNSCDISNKKLGERLGRHEVTVSHSLTWLKQAGLLTVTPLPEQGNRRLLTPTELLRTAYVVGDGAAVAAHLAGAPAAYQPTEKRGGLSETLIGGSISETLRPLSVDAKTLLANGYDPLSVDAKTCLLSVYNQSTISNDQSAATASEPAAEEGADDYSTHGLSNPEKEITTPPESPNASASHTGGAAGRARKAPAGEPAEFAAFYEAYPKREKRKEALAAWRKLSPDDQALALERATAWFTARPDLAQPDRQRFIPHPASWLNQARWTDDAPSQLKPLHSSGHVYHASNHKSETLADLGGAVDQYFALKYGH